MFYLLSHFITRKKALLPNFAQLIAVFIIVLIPFTIFTALVTFIATIKVTIATNFKTIALVFYFIYYLAKRTLIWDKHS